MKFLTLPFLIILTSFGIAQEWAPTGAKWHYNYTGSSYSIFESVGDTVISGKTCRKILKSKDYSGWGNRPVMEYTYYSNDSVYFYDENYPGFYLLYDFDASPGDVWYYQFPGDSYAGDVDSIKITVDSTDMVTINSYSLKRLYVHYDTVNFENPDDCYFLCNTPGTIIEYIGDTLNMFSTFTMDEVIFDMEYPSGLRCYDDSIIGHYETGIVDSCNWVDVTEIPDSKIPEEKASIRIYPNPTTDILYLDLDKDYLTAEFTYEIMTLSGEEIYRNKYDQSVPNQLIDISFISKGVYLLSIVHPEKGKTTLRFIKN